MSDGDRNELIKKLKQSGKCKEICDTGNFEVYTSAVISIFITIIIIWLYEARVDMNSLNELIRNVSLYIAAALIGLLGFTISGLAIMSSTMSTNVIKMIDDDDNMDSLLNVFLSFYFAGFVIGFTIFIFLVIYIITYFPYNFNLLIIIAFSLIATYLVSFIVFYSISLLGTCISMFQINYNFSKGLDMSKSLNGKEKGYTLEIIRNNFNNYRINALGKVLIDSEVKDKQYKEILQKSINTCKDDELKKLIFQYFEQLYGNSNNK